MSKSIIKYRSHYYNLDNYHKIVVWLDGVDLILPSGELFAIPGEHIAQSVQKYLDQRVLTND